MRSLLVVLALTGSSGATPCAKLAASIDATATKPVCTKLKQTLQLVAYEIADPNAVNEVLHPAALIAGDAIVWRGDPGAHATPNTVNTFSVADLDRDGRDELLIRRIKRGHEHSTSGWIEVKRISTDGPVGEEVALAVDLGSSRIGPAAACIATDTIVGDTIVVTRRRTGEMPLQECPPETRYTLRATPK